MRERLVETEVNQGVLTIELNRPDRLNAQNFDSLSALASILEAADSDPTVNAILLSGRGRAFCSGWDRDATIDGDSDAMRLDSVGRRAIDALRLVRQPTVAALNGPVVGGGVVLAAACDLRIAGEDCYFWLPEALFGSPLLWSGLAPLVREIGHSATRDLAFTGEKRSASWAQHNGLVHSVHQVETVPARAHELVQALASAPPAGLQNMKRDLACIEAQSLPSRHPFGRSEILNAVTSDSFRAAMQSR